MVRISTLIIVFLNLSCTSSFASSLPSSSPSPAKICPLGVYTPFILRALPQLPSSKKFPFGYSKNGNEAKPITFIAAGMGQDNIELRLCLDPQSFQVLSILSLAVTHSKTPWSRETDTLEYTWNPSWRVKGLNEALFQDYSNLEILAQLEGLKAHYMEAGAIHIKGWHAGSQAYLTVGHVNDPRDYDKVESQPMEPAELQNYLVAGVLVGELIQDELPVIGQCKSYETFRSITFTAASAHFRLHYCSFKSTDSDHFRFVKLFLKDTSASLNAPLDLQFDAPHLQDKLEIAEGHHATGLGFRLNLPEVSYIVMDLITGDGGYNVHLPDGPSEEEVEALKATLDFGTRSSIFRSKYGDAAWSSLSLTNIASLQKGGEGFFTVNPDSTEIFNWDSKKRQLTDKCLLGKNSLIHFIDQATVRSGGDSDDALHQIFLIDTPIADCPQLKAWVSVVDGTVQIQESVW